jgi:hypothetical protein
MATMDPSRLISGPNEPQQQLTYILERSLVLPLSAELLSLLPNRIQSLSLPTSLGLSNLGLSLSLNTNTKGGRRVYEIPVQVTKSLEILLKGRKYSIF